jgi:uncharacterized protein
LNVIYPSEKIYIAPSLTHGMGVFARIDIKKGEVIEESPLLVIHENQLSDLTKTELFEYYFAWGKGFKSAAVVWGYGSLFNHSYTPNAKYIKDEDNKLVKFVAIRNINKDDEILVNYNGKPNDKTKLWFEARKNF